jgi:hypothetical protein
MKMIKLICIRDTKDYYYSSIKKGEIILSYYDYKYGTIPCWVLQQTPLFIGYFNSADFLPLDEWRVQQINKILKNE